MKFLSKSRNANTVNFLCFFIVILITTVSLSSCSSIYYSIAIERNDKSDVVKSSSREESSEDEKNIFLKNKKWFLSQPYTTLQITSNDGLKLKGYWLPHFDENGNTSKNTVILVHGYSGSAFTMGPFAKTYFEDFGFNVLMPDARGHGSSEGDYIGFGWPDRFDILDWTNEVTKLIGDDCDIVLHGISMGGATVLMVSGEALPSQIKCIVEDCGYTSVWDELRFQMIHFRNIKNPDPILERTSEYTKRKVGYGFKEASALEQVKKATVPILFIHGGADSFVPTEMVYELYDACPTTKELFVVDGAEHGRSCVVAEEEYIDKVKNFIRREGLIPRPALAVF
ncbi:MAG: alpha/beta hydrolase [Spirochaetales bacterium]|nr:alpha/beta hydrolase [Spirochaetales bacterium]